MKDDRLARFLMDKLHRRGIRVLHEELSPEWVERHDIFIDQANRLYALEDSGDAVHFALCIEGDHAKCRELGIIEMALERRAGRNDTVRIIPPVNVSPQIRAVSPSCKPVDLQLPDLGRVTLPHASFTLG